MSKIRPSQEHRPGQLSGADRCFGIVASRYNRGLVEALVGGAVDCLERHGVSPAGIEVVWVPGAWEIPLALEVLGEAGRCDALIAIGVLIRGETAHFDYISAECSSGVARVSMAHRLPIGFGVLTCETTDQARDRAGGKYGNKGWEAALAALEMADLLPRIGSQAGTD